MRTHNTNETPPSGQSCPDGNWGSENAHEAATDLAGAAFARALRQGEQAVPHDIRERLRVARLAAVHAHQRALARQAAQDEASTIARRRQSPFSGWRKALAALPIAAAAGIGAIFMQGAVSEDVPHQQVETDLHILSSEVPPSAFADPAFGEYLKRHKLDAPHARP